MLKAFLKKILPKNWLSLYHKFLAILATVIYGFPSEKLIVIGVTGTKGKTTVCEMIARVLEEGGFKVGLISTISIKIADQHFLNTLKMTMPGRTKLQKLLRAMVRAGCQYAVIETSSEGIKQWRHLGINYDIAVFTSLSPEHLQSHGNFANYKLAKAQLFKRLTKKYKIINSQPIKKIIIANADDPYADYFLQFPADFKDTYRLKEASEYNLNLKLLGGFNLSNALAAIHLGLSQGISVGVAKQALGKIETIPGRMEVMQTEPFMVIVDYAHEPKSLTELYKSAKQLSRNKIITVIGAEGGGRDKSKRPIMGKLSAEACDYVIITNVDPYNDPAWPIIEDIKKGALEGGKRDGENLFCIEDRRAAIKKAISLAQAGDVVLITGKGAEQVMVIAGKKYPWDDRQVVREILGCG